MKCICFAQDCLNEGALVLPFCQPHWYMVPADKRSNYWQTWMSYKREPENQARLYWLTVLRLSNYIAGKERKAGCSIMAVIQHYEDSGLLR